MTTNTTAPKKIRGARYATKQRIITIFLLLVCAFIFLFWKERPSVTLYNNTMQTLVYTIKIKDQVIAKGSLSSNTKQIINLPLIKGRNASVYFQATTQNRIISSLARTELLGGISFYIQPDFNISMTETPQGFLTEQVDTDETIIK